MKKIAVLTSGGDAPGMNACIRAIVRSGEMNGIEVIGINNGYQGLIDGSFQQLSHKSVENIIQLGGTILKTSRCKEFQTKTGLNKALKNIKKEKFDALITIGGDGTLHGAIELMESGIGVVAIPSTIDNDLAYTDLTIGFDTAVNTVMQMLGNIKETSASHNRICVVEVMGRTSGNIALMAGTASGAEIILVPEVKFNERALFDKIRLSTSVGEKCVLIVVAEGVSSAQEVANLVKNKMNIDAKSVDIGYIQRGGSPTATDRILATKMGAFAIEEIKNGKLGIAIRLNKNKISSICLNDVFKEKSNIDKNLLKTNDILSI